MPTSEALLQELVNLKKNEIRGKRIKFWIHFGMITLPSFILIVVSIYAAWTFATQAAEIVEQFPQMMEEMMESQKDGFIEGVQDKFR